MRVTGKEREALLSTAARGHSFARFLVDHPRLPIGMESLLAGYSRYLIIGLAPY